MAARSSSPEKDGVRWDVIRSDIRTFSRRLPGLFRNDYSAVMLVVANIVPVIDMLIKGDPVGSILVIYWMQMMIIGFWTCVKLVVIARWRALLLAAGYGILVYGVLEPGRMLLLGRRSKPSRLWTALSGEGDLNRYLPSLSHHPEAAEIRVALLWVAALASLLVLDALSRSRPWADRAFGGLALPLAVLLLVGAGVDHWARRGDQGEVSAQPRATLQPSRSSGSSTPEGTGGRYTARPNESGPTTC